MPNRRVVFRGEALAQLDELYDYVAVAGSPVLAADLVDAILTFCEGLVTFPLRGVARNDIRLFVVKRGRARSTRRRGWA